MSRFAVSVIVIWLCLCGCATVGTVLAGDVYRAMLTDSVKVSLSLRYEWREVIPVVDDEARHEQIITLLHDNLPRNATAEWFSRGRPVYVSLTSIFGRVQQVYQTILSLLCGQATPTHVYLFLSEEGFLLDKGVPLTSIPQELIALVATQRLTIVYTDNIGPHRKLLPLLDKVKDENVLIVNVDDDIGGVDHSDVLYQLLKSYVSLDSDETRTNTVVALRARRLGLCRQEPHSVTKYVSWAVQSRPLAHSEMLLLPTGTGGVLYHPSQFHPVVFDDALRRATSTADDLMFRLATMVSGVYVRLGCDANHRKCAREKLDEKFNDENDTHITFSAQHMVLRLRAITQANTTNTQNDDNTINEDAHNTALFKINKKSKNDRAWKAAVRFLAHETLLDFSELVRTHLAERGETCMAKEAREAVSKLCALWMCKMRPGNATTNSNIG